MAFADSVPNIDDLAVQQPEISRIQGNAHIGNSEDNPVKKRCAGFLEPGFTLTFCPYSKNNLVAFFPFLD